MLPLAFRFLLPRRRAKLIKILFIFIIVYLCYNIIFKIFSLRNFHTITEAEYEIHKQKIDREKSLKEMVQLRIVPNYNKRRHGPGENGLPIRLWGSQALEAQEIMKTWFINIVASDLISLDRSVPDTRHYQCKNVEYNIENLPNVSVVIIFHNEAFSIVARTVHSIFNRSPWNLLHEIVLVDDASTREDVKEKLEVHMKRFPKEKIKFVRLEKRQGLIRARLEGAKAARGQVLIFLDAHCEANKEWLEPLVKRIKEKRTAVLCPIIDVINDQTLAYTARDTVRVGGFTWSLLFDYTDIREEVKKNRKSELEPLNSATMAGGLFAMDREYFFEIGAYDEGMEVWGGENLEISFRVWMCGGSLEFVPCSRVGHIYRQGHPYDMTKKDVHGINSARLAEVWMDDYKRLFYRYRPDLINAEIGNISERLALRRRLKCHDFKWYMKNIYPEKIIFDEDALAYGWIKNPATNLCLDSLQRNERFLIKMGVDTCRGQSMAQFFFLSEKWEITREENCLFSLGGDGGKVYMDDCDGKKKNQKWLHSKHGRITHGPTGKCVDVAGLKAGDDLVIRSCQDGSETQEWVFEKYVKL